MRKISGSAKDHDSTRLRHRTTRKTLEQRINRHFVGHSSAFVLKAAIRTYVSTRAGVNTHVRVCPQTRTIVLVLVLGSLNSWPNAAMSLARRAELGKTRGNSLPVKKRFPSGRIFAIIVLSAIPELRPPS